jgi:hypothetical protein
MRRAGLVAVLSLVVLAPPAALAQSGGSPFGPLPQPSQPAPAAPKPQPRKRDATNDGLGGRAFWLIIGTTGALFFGVAFYITRDMRRASGARRRRRRGRGPARPARAAADALAAADAAHKPGSHRARAKAQKRAKTKAARKQRRQSRAR